MSRRNDNNRPIEKRGIGIKLRMYDGGVIAIVAQTESQLLEFLKHAYPQSEWDREKFAVCHVAKGVIK